MARYIGNAGGLISVLFYTEGCNAIGAILTLCKEYKSRSQLADAHIKYMSMESKRLQHRFVKRGDMSGYNM